LISAKLAGLRLGLGLTGKFLIANNADVKCPPGQVLKEGSTLRGLFHNKSVRSMSIRSAARRALLSTVAILIVSVGALSAGSRLPTSVANTGNWHTAKVARMAPSSGDESASFQRETTLCVSSKPIRQAGRLAPSEDIPRFAVSFPQSGLRAPPRF
jgi:hypothetical protein